MHRDAMTHRQRRWGKSVMDEEGDNLHTGLGRDQNSTTECRWSKRAISLIHLALAGKERKTNDNKKQK